LIAIVKDNRIVLSAKTGDTVQLVFNQTPFYAESGGQIGDQGEIISGANACFVSDTKNFLVICLFIIAK
jgi:Alanyl-tRNA synthetase